MTNDERPEALPLRNAAFLDRDGTIIRDTGYPADPAAVRLLPGAAEAISHLNSAGVQVIIVTNQSGIGRGLYTVADFRTVQREVEQQLEEAGATVDAVYFCPHDPRREVCACRKPGLGLYERAARERGITLRDSIYLGDRPRDVLPATALGGLGVLVADPGVEYDEPVPAECLRVSDIRAGVRIALDRLAARRRPADLPGGHS